MKKQGVTCPADEVLAAWSAGVLDGRERADVESHAAGCAACRGLAVAMAGVTPRERSSGVGAEGATIDRYRIVGSIGQGAMGVVLRGHDPVLDREVAIKMIGSPTATGHRERMLREAQTLARIGHANVVQVFDAGIVGDEVFVAMEYVVGETLTRWLSESTRSTAHRIAVLTGVGSGISAVHAAGLVHRDIKPDNILVRASGEAVLIDFGLARESATATAAGSGIAGTPRFLAPELLGGALATSQSDQFAWWTVVDDTLRTASLSARQRRSLDRAIERGRSADPAARFASIDDAVAALGPTRRRTWPWLAVAGIVAAAATIALLSTRDPDDDPCAVAFPSTWVRERPVIAERLGTSGVNIASVVGALELRAWRTTAERGRACRAARSDDAATRTRGLRQQLCVDESWLETEHIFPGLEDKDPQVVRAAIDDLIRVLPVERCAEGVIPGVPAPPPTERLAEARAIEAAFRDITLGADQDPNHRIARLRSLEPRVRALHHAPHEAQWHADLAGQLAELGDSAGSRRELETSIQISETAGDDDARTRGLINRLRLAKQTGEPDTAAIERSAEAAAARLGNPGITAELYASEGMVRYAHGDLPGALAAMRAAKRELDGIAIEAHGQLVANAQNLGAIEQASGDLRAAQVTYDRGYALARIRYGDDASDTFEIRGARATNTMYAGDPARARPELAIVAAGLERRLGAGAAEVAQARTYVCEADIDLGSRDAEQTCDAALAAATRAFGESHPQIAWQLGLVGQQRLVTGRFADAIPFLERSLAISEHAALGPSERPVAQAYLALALHGLGREPARAKVLARDALSVMRPMPDKLELVGKLDKAFPAR